MVAITGGDTFFTNIDSAFTATKWEAFIDQAIDKINGYAGDTIIPNLSGTAGSKTVTVTSQQAGFIRELAAAIYSKDYKNKGAESDGFGIAGVSASSSSSSQQIEALAKSAAQALLEMEVSLG